jgi:hypothetical protein
MTEQSVAIELYYLEYAKAVAMEIQDDAPVG